MAGAESSAAQQLEFLRELNRSRDLDKLAQVVVEHGVNLVPGAQRGSFIMLNRTTGCYEFRAAMGWDMEALRRVTFPASQLLQRQVYGDLPTIVQEPYRKDRALLSEVLVRTLEYLGPLRAILTFPIQHHGEVIAYLNLDNVEDPDAFSDDDVQLLEPVMEDLRTAVWAVLGREHLASMERSLRLLFEKLADAVYIAEFNGTILDANEAASEQSGYPREELIGLNIMEDLAYAEPVVTYNRVIDELHKGELIRFEELKRRKDGTLYTTECAVTVTEYQGRQVTLSINRDVTGQREAQADLEQRNDELEALLHASGTLSATLELESLLEQTQQQIPSLIPCDSFFIALLDQRKQRLSFELLVERGVSLARHIVPLDPEASLTAWVAHTGEPLLIGDTETDPLPAVVNHVGEPTRSWLGVPLQARGETVGVMSVQAFAPHAFTEAHQRLVTTFASLAAVSISNAELHEEMTTLQRKLLAVERAARMMKLAESTQELYTQLLRTTEEVFGYEASGILEGEPGVLKVTMACGDGPVLGNRLPLEGPGVTVAAWNTGEPVYVADVSADARYVEGVRGTKSELALPFWVGARKAGVFDVQSSMTDGIPPEDRNLLEILLAHMAVALVGLERLEAGKRLSEKLQRLHQAVRRMQRCPTVEELCHTGVRTASEALGIKECNVGLVEGDFLIPVASSSDIGRFSQPMRCGEGVAGKTWATGKTLWGKLSEFPFAKPSRSDFRAVISIPIGKEGVFQAVSTSEEAFTESDVALAEVLAGHLHGAIGRIRLEEELREQAMRDALTGLYNRRFLVEVLEREVEHAKRYAHPLSVIMADIDRFKEVNDRFGHLKGDQVLREVARLLQESVRASDYVFRYGGEEFVILMPETANRAGEVIERLQQAVHQWALNAELGDFSFGLTMGSAVWDPRSEKDATPEALLHRADQVLYSFKRKKGR